MAARPAPSFILQFAAKFKHRVSFLTMAVPEMTTTRMELRKREAPTAALVMHRDALISRFSKRRRVQASNYRAANSESDTIDERDGSETESDYDERPTRKAVTGAIAVTRPRRAPVTKLKQIVRTSSTDKALTFLQSAQLQNNPVRSGKWNEDEEAYLRKLVHVFNNGILDGVETKTSMRMWLAKMLHCCPMRISKKQMHGEKFKGKAKYYRNADRIERMGQKDFDKTYHELHLLRANFLKFWAKEEFSRWGNGDRSHDFGKWYDTVVRNVPEPHLAKNDRLVEPKTGNTVDPWVIIKKDLEEVPRKKKSSRHHRELKKWMLQQVQSTESPPAPTVVAESPVTGACQDMCPVSTIDFPISSHESIFEPIQPATLGVEIDLATLVSEWDNSVPTCASSYKPICEEQNRNPYPPQPSPGIVLDFGPPSLWDVDPISKDSSSPSHCELIDDLLGQDSLLTFDPAVLTPCDLPTEPWFQQLCKTFQL